MELGFRGWMSLLLGGALVYMGLLPQLGVYLYPITGMVRSIIILLALIFLIIDGFGEEHALKTITLVFGLLIAIYLAIPFLNAAGWLSFSLPGYVLGFEGWIVGIGGVFLLLGAFKG